MEKGAIPPSGKNELFWKFDSIPGPANHRWLWGLLCASDKRAPVGDNESALALKPMGRVIRSPKHRVSMTPQNGPIKTLKNEIFLNLLCFYFESHLSLFMVQ